jgi:hypothetical protein
MNFPGSDEDRRLVGMVTKFDPIGDLHQWTGNQQRRCSLPTGFESYRPTVRFSHHAVIYLQPRQFRIACTES